eukprot:5827241-Amphidinium_carterae.1
MEVTQELTMQQIPIATGKTDNAPQICANLTTIDRKTKEARRHKHAQQKGKCEYIVFLSPLPVSVCEHSERVLGSSHMPEHDVEHGEARLSTLNIVWIVWVKALASEIEFLLSHEGTKNVSKK